ncbi:PqqD family peptide modification chaperone [Kitasatospora sp. NPDC018058]|uniref:PqqD family peptide modification chaperone n=1 Tax=Kitasatospora sp. NPDC018058 TaxID=3364025 RepID=UPI0037BF773F
MPSSPETTALEPWLDTERLRMRDGVEIITGAGGRTMLVSPAGRYLNISPSGLAILRHLGDGMTGTELLASLTERYPEQESQIRAVLPDFLADLRRASVLNLDPLPATGTERAIRYGRLDLVKRFPLVRDPSRFADPVAGVLRRLPVRPLAALLLAVPVIAVPLAVLALTSSTGSIHPTAWMVAAAVAVMLGEIVVHEFCHAVAMTYNRVRPRNAGVGLMLYLFPMAYVDRTDSYRHEGRFGRVLISLVGPICDLTFAGAWSLAALNTTGDTALFFRILLGFQLMAVVANINPLFPSDGYHAVEAALGAINMRGRALTYVLHRVTRKPLPLYLRSIPGRVRAGYVCYFAVSLLYTLLAAGLILFNLLSLAIGLMS